MISTILGLAASALSLINFIPQTLSTVKARKQNKNIEGIAKSTYLLLATDFVFWMIYGSLTGGTWQFGISIVNIAFCSTIAFCLTKKSSPKANITKIVLGVFLFSIFAIFLWSQKQTQLTGIIATIIGTIMFAPQARYSVQSTLRREISGLTLSSAVLQMIATPGAWMLYGFSLGATWTWISAIPQIACGIIVVAFKTFVTATNKQESIIVNNAQLT